MKVEIRRQDQSKTMRQFITDNNLQNLPKEEQRNVFNMYQKILTSLQKNAKTNKTVNIGKLSQVEIKALAIALREVAPKYHGKILIKTTTESGAADYLHVNPETIKFLDELLDEIDGGRDSISGFGWAIQRNQSIDIIFQPTDEKIHQITKRSNGEFFPYDNDNDLDLSFIWDL